MSMPTRFPNRMLSQFFGYLYPVWSAKIGQTRLCGKTRHFPKNTPLSKFWIFNIFGHMHEHCVNQSKLQWIIQHVSFDHGSFKKHIYSPQNQPNPAPVYPRLSGHMIPQAEQQKNYDISSHITVNVPMFRELANFLSPSNPISQNKTMKHLQPLVSATIVAMSRSWLWLKAQRKWDVNNPRSSLSDCFKAIIAEIKVLWHTR